LVLYRVLFGLDITSPYVCIGLALVLGVAVPTALSVLRERSPAVQLLFESPDFHLPPVLARLAGKLDRWLLPPSTAPAAPRSFDQSTIPGSSANP
jgi:hypothetical protein